MTLLIIITNIMNTRQSFYTYEAQRTGRLEIQCGTFLEVKADINGVNLLIVISLTKVILGIFFL